LAIAFVIVAPQWALSNEAKQKCYYETHENISWHPRNVVNQRVALLKPAFSFQLDV